MLNGVTRDTAALLVCAGNATRMGGIHKILHPLGSSTVLAHILQTVCACDRIAEVIVICRQQDTAEFEAALETRAFPIPIRIVTGGSTRQESVRNGFAAIRSACTWVAIHDGARPLLRLDDFARVIADAEETDAASLGVPVKDTIKTVKDGIITDTPERSALWLTQTPQVFRRTLYAAAMEKAEADGKDYTDDCQLVEALNRKVRMTAGSYDNIKLTTTEDFAIAEALLRLQQTED